MVEGLESWRKAVTFGNFDNWQAARYPSLVSKAFSTMAESVNLRAHLESLSQELYDMIYYETFNTTPSNNKVLIRWSWLPPSITQVNKITRDKTVDLFYLNRSFMFVSPTMFRQWKHRHEHIWNSQPGKYITHTRIARGIIVWRSRMVQSTGSISGDVPDQSSAAIRL